MGRLINKNIPTKEHTKVHVVDGFYEYTDDDQPYQQLTRTDASQKIVIRLYCFEDGCKQYIRGTEGYNGSFTAETGQTADLRNDCWYCNKHQPKKP
jgi:hypothetical protein